MTEFPDDHFSRNQEMCDGLITEFERFKAQHNGQLKGRNPQFRTMQPLWGELVNPANRWINAFINDLTTDVHFESKIYDCLNHPSVESEFPLGFSLARDGEKLLKHIYCRLVLCTLKNCGKWKAETYNGKGHWFRLLQSESSVECRGDNLREEVRRAVCSFFGKPVRKQNNNTDLVAQPPQELIRNLFQQVKTRFSKLEQEIIEAWLSTEGVGGIEEQEICRRFEIDQEDLNSLLRQLEYEIANRDGKPVVPSQQVLR